MFFRFWIKLFFIFLCVSHSYAKEGEVLTLDEAITEALGANPSLKAKESEVQAFKEHIGVERSLEEPMFGLEFEEVPISTTDVTQGMMANYSLIQKFPFPSKLISKGNKAKKEYLSKQSELETAKLDIIRNTEHAYHELFLQERMLKINRELQGIFSRFLASEKGRFETGHISAQNFLKIKVELEKLKSEGAMLEAQAIQSTAMLNILRHRDPFEEVHLTELPSLKHELSSYAELEKRVRSQHPEIKASEQMLEAAKSNVSYETQQNFIPDFQARFTYNQRFNQENAWTAEGMISIPFIWGKNRRALKEALAMKKRNESELLAKRDEVLGRLKEMFYRFESAKKSYQILQHRALPAATLALQSAQAVYETGGGEFLMWIDSARELKEAKLKALEALVEMHRAHSELKYAVGGNL